MTLAGYQYRKALSILGATGAGTHYSMPIVAHFDDYYFSCDGEGYALCPFNEPVAAYYSGIYHRTYIVFQGLRTSGDGDPYITYYDHDTGIWAKPVKIAANPLPPADMHGSPVILIRTDTGHVGNIIVAFGGHASYWIQWVESTNPEDISSWGAPANLGQGSFPKLMQLPSGGDIYCFYRTHNGVDSRFTGYRKMAAEGSSWGSEVDLLDWSAGGGDTSYELFTLGAIYDSASGKIWFSLAQLQGVVGGVAFFKDIYAYAFKPSDGKVYDIVGNSFSPTVTKSDFDNASYKFVAYAITGTERTYLGPIALDSNGYPHIIFGDWVGGESLDYSQFYVKWNGSAWISPMTINSLNYGSSYLPGVFNFRTILLNSTTDIHAFIGGTDHNLEDWHYDGSSWTLSSTVLAISTEPSNIIRFAFPFIPVGFQSDLSLIFVGFDPVTYANQRIYAYGASGFVPFKCPGYVTCEGYIQDDFDDVRFTDNDGETLLSPWIESKYDKNYAKFWVKVADDLTSNQSIYAYYGKADATSTSSLKDAMTAGDDGVAGNFTEAVAGSGAFSHTGGYYKLTEGAAADAGMSGCILPDWNFQSVIKVFQSISGGGGITFFGLVDSDTVANVPGASGTFNPKRRFYIARYDHNHGTYPDRFLIVYFNAAGTAYIWTGSGWSTSVTYLNLTSGNVYLKLWSDGTNFLADIINITTGLSYLTAVASIAIANVKEFSSGKVLAWGEPYSDLNYETQQVDNYYIRKYVSPEPTWGIPGIEENLLGGEITLSCVGAVSDAALMSMYCLNSLISSSAISEGSNLSMQAGTSLSAKSGIAEDNLATLLGACVLNDIASIPCSIHLNPIDYITYGALSGASMDNMCVLVTLFNVISNASLDHMALATWLSNIVISGKAGIIHEGFRTYLHSITLDVETKIAIKSWISVLNKLLFLYESLGSGKISVSQLGTYAMEQLGGNVKSEDETQDKSIHFKSEI